MGIKISELESTTTANANDVFIINQNGATKKITKENLENQIINPELEERVDVLEEEVEALQNQVTDLEETVNSELEDGTAEGTEITVNDSTVADASLDIDGNTEQIQYEGYNLIDINSNSFPTQTINGVTITNKNDGSLLLNGTSTNVISKKVSADMNNLAVGTYMFLTNASGTLSGGTITNIIYGKNESESAETLISSTSDTTQKTTTKIYEQYYYWIYIPSGRTFTNYILKPLLISGTTAKPYEPFVGGQASPSPDFPQNIHILKGSNAIKISNKNKIKISTTNRTLSGVTITNNNNEDVTLNGTATATSGGLSLLNSNTDYPIADLPRFLTFCVKDSLPTGVELAMAYGTSTGGWISNIIVLNSNKKMESISLTNIPSNAEFVRFNFTVQSGTVLNNVVVKPMILDGIYTATTLPEYEPHKEITKTLTLPSGLEMCKIGNYKDEFVKDLSTGKWYKDEKITKAVFDGSEDWKKYGSSKRFYLQNLSDIIAPSSNTEIAKIICNSFTVYSSSDTSSNTNIDGISVDTAGVLMIRLAEYNDKTLDEFKTWLSTHNVGLYYVRLTPQLIEITDETLISELDELLKLRTYFGQTNITVEAGDAKPYMTLNYKKSNRAATQSELVEIKQAILSLGGNI